MSGFERFLRRYPYTIACAVIVAVALLLLGRQWQNSRECEREGGAYVRTFGGWECVR